jgi:hypothetical protein
MFEDRRGKRAPLRRVDIAAPRPPDLAFIRDIVYTPSLVVIEDGRENGRIAARPNHSDSPGEFTRQN